MGKEIWQLKKETILISIIVPCYNGYHFLPLFIQEIKKQTVKEWECIIVNDGSSDRSSDEYDLVLSSFNDDRISIVHKTNGGPSSARNTGAKLAKHDWLIFIDVDDFISHRFLEKSQAVISKSDIIFSDHIEFSDSACKIKHRPLKDIESLKWHNWLSGAGVLMRKKVWAEVGGYDEAEILRPGLEDAEFWCRVASHGLRIKKLNYCYYYYRIANPNSLMGSLSYRWSMINYIYRKNKSLFSIEDKVLFFKYNLKKQTLIDIQLNRKGQLLKHCLLAYYYTKDIFFLRRLKHIIN